ncbi:hypothetical protein CAPTEDRAFT_193781 [Capitella teleta]|uniref:WSC domain-containing protein n=1 Tax=Capitella teleta TaxID=283909 RepID=R7VG75_CAPTE|nr:hypothetical protein CAPTEDRAFT_193781 [Capitella teleta]|eukprot:ELU15301.1 hypothetical protein CAPTEDRAFT_193781 [Capitella teleta]
MHEEEKKITKIEKKKKRIGWTDASASNSSHARWECKLQNHQLPDLASVRSGSLNSELDNGDSTWIDAWIERGPWMWHTTYQELHQNQGCFYIPGTFIQQYVQEESYYDLSGCINTCKSNGYAYTGVSMILNETLLCYCCNELPSQYERDDDNCGAECINGDDVCGYENYARVIANEAYVTSEPVSWFVAQEFCHDVEVTHDTYTERLYTNTIANIADLDEIDHTEDYWTQLSSLHLISPDPTDTFGDLPWTDGYPESEDGICIRAEKINDEIELITSDCDDDFQFICFSSKPGEESVTPPTDESTTQMGIIIGSVIGGSIVVIIVVVALAVFLVLKSHTSSPTPPLKQGSKQATGDAGEAGVYEGLADVQEEIPNAYESIDVRKSLD